MALKKICLLFGGKSPEHSIAVKSGLNIMSALSRSRYSVEGVYINPAGRIGTKEELKEVYSKLEEQNITSSGLWEKAFCNVFFNPDVRFFQHLYQGRYDMVFPVFHGAFGEDGSIQGLCDFFQVPYAGSHTAASALCLDKELAKKVCSNNGITSIDYITINEFQWRQQAWLCRSEIKGKLGFPLFCKPCRLGSSLGVNRAEDSESLDECIDLAFSYDSKVIVEKALDVTEYSVGVIGNDTLEVSVPALVNLNPHFFDFDAKYGEEAIDDIIPAPLNEETTKKLQELALQTYRALDITGMARLDFFQTGSTFFFNEANTIPGFGGTSLFNKMWEKSGLEFTSLLDRIIDYGFERFDQVRMKKYF